MGYHRAGFDVVGVDIKPQPHYPFEFHQWDALSFLTPQFAHLDFDAIHASPPCQAYSDLQRRSRKQYPDLIGTVRAILKASRLPWVIENVPEAPLINPVVLCGTMFPTLQVIRHRAFESNVRLIAPEYHRRHPLVFTHDKRKGHYGKLDQNRSFVQVTGGGNATVANKQRAMNIDWMTGKEINEAIPPAYTEFIGQQLMAHLKAKSDV
jgi:DNA (cytosine-5)-methyltransferase 1